MEDAIDDNEHGAAFLDVHTGINDESPVAHAQVAHRYATRADEATADGQHDAARNLHLQASKSFLAAAGMPGADSGNASMKTDAAASETPAAPTSNTTDTASATQSEASTPVDGLVSHGLLLLARSQARAAEQAHWRSRLQKKEEKPCKADSTRGAASAGGNPASAGASSSNPSDAMVAHDRGRDEVHSSSGRRSTTAYAADGEASAAAGAANSARSATGSGAAAELWPKTADLSTLSSPPPSPNRKFPSTEQSHSQTPPEVLADSVMGAPISKSSNASKASKATQDAAVARSVAREFLALEQALKRFGAQPLRQPPAKPSSAYSSSSSGGSSGRGYSGFNSPSPFLKGNGALSPSSLTKRNGGSSGHLSTTLTSLAEEETSPPDKTPYNRGHDWRHNLGSSFNNRASNDKDHHLSSLLGESFLELTRSSHGNRPSSHTGNGYGGGSSSGGDDGVRAGAGSGSHNHTGDDQAGGPTHSGDSLSHSLFSIAVASSPRGGGGGCSGGVGRFVSSQELQGQAAELARCLRLTQLLHDENAKLLEDREAYQRAAAAAADEKAAVERFKVEYRELFAKARNCCLS